jgi:hypothetical protein
MGIAPTIGGFQSSFLPHLAFLLFSLGLARLPL